MEEKLSYIESLNLASYSVRNNDLISALKICKSYSIEEVDDQRLNFIYAAILNQLGMYEEAIKLYHSIIDNGYKNDLIYFQLGVAYFFNDNYDQAQKFWINSPYFKKFFLALNLVKEKSYKEAITTLSSFINENKDYVDVNLDAKQLIQVIKLKVSDEDDDKYFNNEESSKSIDITNNDDFKEKDEELKSQNLNSSTHHDVASILSIYTDK
ncbi:tetratricopeptide repeat protein [Photobacterium leiognathi]|uniref:tetratricopeptide repeat protein n=1 Tax=Photobacterium leiognathi TaxID=553611 RepID=UPI0029825C2D|nr:hypothetical protein [Photobacterium leiognathi]